MSNQRNPLMDHSKKQKQSQREKTKRLFQNSVGVTASAVVVVVATPLFDNVTANFINIKLLEDSIYYELEVLEAVGEDEIPNGYPLRLIIENQWERIEVDLEYGITSNVINNLRPNANYSFKVEMDKGLTWVTLTSQRFQTENEIAGIIGAISYRDQDTRMLDFNVFTQAGGIPISFYFLDIYEDETLLETLEVKEGEQSLNYFLPIQNRSYTFALKGVSQTGQLYALDERVFIPDAVFNNDIDISLISIDQVLVRNTFEESEFNPVYTLEIIENKQALEPIILSGDDLTLSLDTGKDYTFNVFISYQDERTDERYQKRIYQTRITTPEEIFFVINEIKTDDGIRYLLNLENFNDNYLNAYIRIINPRTGRILKEDLFKRIADRFSTSLFEYTLDAPLGSNQTLIIGVELKDSNLKVPLYTVTP